MWFWRGIDVCKFFVLYLMSNKGINLYEFHEVIFVSFVYKDAALLAHVLIEQLARSQQNF